MRSSMLGARATPAPAAARLHPHWSRGQTGVQTLFGEFNTSSAFAGSGCTADAAMAGPSGRRRCLLDFSSTLPAAPQWFSVDDRVMGGASSSGLVHDAAQGAAVFKGNVTTAYNGGFASVRSSPWAGWGQLARAEAVELVVRGDGRTYKLNLKTHDNYDGISYQQDFTTKDLLGGAADSPSAGSSDAASGWQQVLLPLRDFKPTFRGRVVAAPPLQGGHVRQLGFMISKFSDNGGMIGGFQPGSYSLACRAVFAVDAE